MHTAPLSPALRSAHAPSPYRGAFLLRYLQQDLPFSIHVFAAPSGLQLYADSPATPNSPLEPLGQMTYPDLHYAEAAIVEGLVSLLRGAYELLWTPNTLTNLTPIRALPLGDLLRALLANSWSVVRTAVPINHLIHPDHRFALTLAGDNDIIVPATFVSTLRLTAEPPLQATSAVISHPTPNGYLAYAPLHPLCIAIAQSQPQSKDLLARAIPLHLQWRDELFGCSGSNSSNVPTGNLQ